MEKIHKTRSKIKMGKLLCTSEFIERARRVHEKGRYSYLRTSYKGSSQMVQIFCCRGRHYFKQKASSHLEGHGCNECPRISQHDFLIRAKAIHGEKYNYDKTVYKPGTEKIEIYCNTCKKTFQQSAHGHLGGRGCRTCRQLSQEEFLQRAREKHGEKYDYSNTVYKPCGEKLEILCKRCKTVFLQSAPSHLAGRGCRHCCLRHTTEQFIAKAIALWGNRHFLYTATEYKGDSEKLTIFCNIHQSYFEQKAGDHLREHNGCSECQTRERSKMERKFAAYLTQMGYPFVQEQEFDKCKRLQNLRFDFFLPRLRLVIEADGIQHFSLTSHDHYANEFEIRKLNDRIKNTFVAFAGIHLLRISFTAFSNYPAIFQNMVKLIETHGKNHCISYFAGQEYSSMDRTLSEAESKVYLPDFVWHLPQTTAA